MNTYTITCPLCGSGIDSNNRVACASCPLHAACAMLCCPNCGYTMVAPEESQLVRGATRLGNTLRRLVARPTRIAPQPSTLADAKPNQIVRISAFAELAPDQRDRLHAYGIQPGQVVRVQAQRPVTVIQVEYLELAMEHAIAQAVEVEAIAAAER